MDPRQAELRLGASAKWLEVDVLARGLGRSASYTIVMPSMSGFNSLLALPATTCAGPHTPLVRTARKTLQSVNEALQASQTTMLPSGAMFGFPSKSGEDDRLWSGAVGSFTSAT